MKLYEVLIIGGLLLAIGSVITLDVKRQEEHIARLAAESKVQTVSEYVKTQMQDKQTRAILCAK